MRSIAALGLLAVAALACAATPDPRNDPPSLEQVLGVATLEPDSGICLRIADRDLRSGDPVLLLRLTSEREAYRAEIIGPTPGPCTGNADGDPAEQSYAIASQSQLAAGVGPLIALLPPLSLLNPDDPDLSMDLDGDGTLDSLHLCTSYEGVHLSAWSGPVHEGRRLWQRYVYLGYDVEPTCDSS